MSVGAAHPPNLSICDPMPVNETFCGKIKSISSSYGHKCVRWSKMVNFPIKIPDKLHILHLFFVSAMAYIQIKNFECPELDNVYLVWSDIVISNHKPFTTFDGNTVCSVPSQAVCRKIGPAL